MTDLEHGRASWLQGAIGDAPGRAITQILARLDGLTTATRLALLWVMGSIALAVVTWVCVQAGANFETAAFALLIVIVLLSLLDSFISSALLSIIAVGCLNFLFVAPKYSLLVWKAQDVVTLVAFFVTSLAVSGLVRRVRSLAGAQRGQDQLRAAIDTIPVIVWSTQSNGENDFHNQRLLSYTGFTPEQALASGWVDMIHPDDLDRHFAAWKAAVATSTSFEVESRLRRFDGEYRWFLARAEPLRDTSGNVVKWYGTNVDIDDRKQAEDARRRSEAYLAEAQRLSRTGSFGWDIATGDVIWSDETFRIFEYEPKEGPSIQMILQRVHPDDLALVRDVIDRAADEQLSLDFEHRLLMPDGSIKYLHVVARRAEGESRSQHFVGAVMDITAQKQAYSELERSEKRYRHLFNHMPIALWQLDTRRLTELLKGLRAEGVTDISAYLDAHPDFLQTCMDGLLIQEVNELTVQLLGVRNAGELVGTSIGPAWQASADTFRRIIESRFHGESRFEEETRITAHGGRVVDVLFSATRVSELQISLIGAVDISQRIRAQEMLNRVQADFAHAARVSVLGELTASIAHEVNQPLAAIAANGEAGLRWLGRPDPDLAELRELTGSVVADARRAADIIGRIRAMAAREAPGRELLSLDGIIRETLLFLRHEVQSRQVSVSHHVSPAAAKVLADRTQLQQVIVNLAVNAMQAMTQAGSTAPRISIRTAIDDRGTLRCAVEDSGPGIEPEHLAHLFDSFFTTKQGGMGMGLPICRSIIEAHGGSIFAESGGPGGGARFSFTLPIAG